MLRLMKIGYNLSNFYANPLVGVKYAIYGKFGAVF